MNKLPLAEAIKINLQNSILAAYLVIALMMTCVTFTLMLLAQRFVPDWEGTYILVIGFLLALEGMYTQRVLRRSGLTYIDRFFSHIAEWVVIMIILRLIVFLLRGPGDLWFSIPLFGGNLGEFFFNTEFIFLVIVGFLIWYLSAQYAVDMFHLEGDEALLKTKEEGGTVRIRSEIRRLIANRVILIGAGMVILIALLRMEAGAQNSLEFQNVNIFILLVYFILGITLLSLIQFSIQRIHWIMDRSYIHANLGRKWFLYSVIFIALLTLLALVLPTEYSVSLLSTLQSVLTFFLGVISTIIALISLPFIWLFGLLMSLLGGEASDPPPPEIGEIMPSFPIAQPGAPPWFEILKSILFWTLLAGVIVASFIIYFNEHGKTFSQLRNISLWRFFGRIFSWLKNLITGMNNTITQKIGQSIQRLRDWEYRNYQPKGYKFINPRKMEPKEQILFYYLSILKRMENKGWTRKPSQTPFEYSKILKELIAVDGDIQLDKDPLHPAENLENVKHDLTQLTDRFVEAKYSEHSVTLSESEDMRNHWQRLIQFVRNIRSR